MSSVIGQPLAALDSPQLVIDLDVVDANLRRMLGAFRANPTTRREVLAMMGTPGGGSGEHV